MEFDDEPILKKLFQFRSDEFESNLARGHEDQLEKNGTRKKQQNLFDALSKHVDKDTDEYTELVHLFNEFDGSYLQEIDYWMEQYYKLGFCDAMKLKKEVDEGGVSID